MDWDFDLFLIMSGICMDLGVGEKSESLDESLCQWEFPSLFHSLQDKQCRSVKSSLLARRVLRSGKSKCSC